MKLSELQIKQLKLWDNDNDFWKETIAVRSFLSFEEAREFVHSLKLKGRKKWNEYCKSGNKPNNIPSNPNKTYIDWISWGDWLDSRTVANINKIFLPFEEAIKFIHSLRLENIKEWRHYCTSGNKPNNIPSAPDFTYKNKGWISFIDWLGNGKIKKEFLSFEEARDFARSLNLKNDTEWREYSKSGNKPNNIPANPSSTYKNLGWIGSKDWLGNTKEFLSYEEAREFIHSLKLKNNKEWREYLKSGNKPKNIPVTPYKTYKDLGWTSIGDWLGTTFLPFEEAKEFVHSLKLQNQKEWRTYCKSGNKPDNIPSNPNKVYKDLGWISMSDWLDNGNVKKEFLTFEEVRDFIHSLNLKSKKEWSEYCKSGNKPNNIPTNPDFTYKNKGWISWGDWLGSNRIADKYKIFLPFEEAKKFAHSLNLKSQKEWYNYSKPNNIPYNPSVAYKDLGWISWGDWLGTGVIANFNIAYLPYEEAREFVHSLNLKGHKEWREYCKSENKPNNIPSNPNITYKDLGWTFWGDWLGNGKIKKGNWRSFEKARKFVKSLNLKSQKEWFNYCKSGNKPNDIPSVPHLIYKNLGWLGFDDWLGK